MDHEPDPEMVGESTPQVAFVIIDAIIVEELNQLCLKELPAMVLFLGCYITFQIEDFSVTDVINQR